METHASCADFPDVLCDPCSKRLCKFPVRICRSGRLDEFDVGCWGHLLHDDRLFGLAVGIRLSALALSRLVGSSRIRVVARRWLSGSDGAVDELTKGSDRFQGTRSNLVYGRVFFKDRREHTPFIGRDIVEATIREVEGGQATRIVAIGRISGIHIIATRRRDGTVMTVGVISSKIHERAIGAHLVVCVPIPVSQSSVMIKIRRR